MTNQKLTQILVEYNDDYRIASIVLSFYYPKYKAEEVYKCLLVGNEDSQLFNMFVSILDNLTYTDAKEFNRIVSFVAIIINSMKINFWKDIFMNETWYTNDFKHFEQEAWKLTYQDSLELA